MAIDNRLRRALIRELGPHLQTTAARRYYLDLAFGAESFRSKLPAEDTSASGQNYAGELIAALDSRYQRTDEDDRYTLVLLLDTMAGDLSGDPSRRLQALATRVQRHYETAPSSVSLERSTGAPTASPSTDATSLSRPAPTRHGGETVLLQSADYEACMAKAERNVQVGLILLMLPVLFVTGMAAYAIYEWFDIAEPLLAAAQVVLFVFGLWLFVLGIDSIGRREIRQWLLSREQERLGCAELRDGGAGSSEGAHPARLLVSESTAGAAPTSQQRADELDFLALREQQIEKDARVRPDRYVTAAGEGEVAEIRPKFEHIPLILPDEMTPLREATAREAWQRAERARTEYDSIFDAVSEIRHAALLGEPGSGKTAALRKLEVEAIERAKVDPAAPIPLFLPLREWLDNDQPLDAFISDQVGPLVAHLPNLLAAKRLIFLLDGLNEVPVDQRTQKAQEVEALFQANPELTALVSCREQDYPRDVLTLDWIAVKKLDELRIREFTRSYLGAEQGETLFWEIAGHRIRNRYDEFMDWYPEANHQKQTSWWRGFFGSEVAPSKVETERRFWLAGSLPDGLEWGWQNSNWQRWIELRRSENTFLALARNAYMLLLMVAVFRESGRLPDNRGQLFRQFVETLLLRESSSEHVPREERLARMGADGVEVLPPGRALLTSLGTLAFQMQQRRSAEGVDSNPVVAVAQAEALEILGDTGAADLRLGMAANILGAVAPVSFAHQLLQEYFAATKLDEERRAGRIAASDLWPADKWWARTGWEETTVLMAGLYSDDCTPVLQWLYEAHPEIAAECVARSGAETAHETLELLRETWKARLIDTEREPHPYARAAVGRALAVAGLDDREGVGVDEQGLPDIVWVEVEGGEYEIGGDEGPYSPLTKQSVTLRPFQMARYPITNAQWTAFLDDEEGYESDAWWAGLEKPEQHSQPRWSYSNHPRETVTWYEAVAFCRWLTARRRGVGTISAEEEIRLPREAEWEAAARGKEGRIYPWGEDEYESGRANIREGDSGSYYLQQTSAVGVYPAGDTPEGISDLSGNVWEWTQPEGESRSVDIIRLRGGSWLHFPRNARAASRLRNGPRDRNYNGGFRVILAPLSRADR